MPAYITPEGIKYGDNARARREAERRGSDFFKTRVVHVRWEEHYSAHFDGKQYHVLRRRMTSAPDWKYEVSNVTAHDSRWIDPDGRIAKRVITAILPLVEA